MLEKVLKGKDIQHFVRNRLSTLNLPLDREEEITKYIQQFKESDIWKDIQSSEEILTEVPFNIKVSAENELFLLIKSEKPQQEIYVTGIII